MQNINESVSINVAPTFDLASGVLGVGEIIPFDSIVTMESGKVFDHIRLSQLTGADNEFQGSGTVSGLRFQLQAGAEATSSLNLYGVIGALSNKGAGATKAIYGRVTGETGSTGVLVSGVFANTPVSTNSTAWILQLSGSDGLNAVAMIHADNVTSADFKDGIVFNRNVRMETSGAFLKAFSTSGHSGDFLNYMNQGGTSLFKVDKDGHLKTGAGINIATASGSTSMTNGFVYIPSGAGAPTGTPTAISGTVPLYYNTTTKKMYAYSGGWQLV